jgi:hypothetical protein
MATLLDENKILHEDGNEYLISDVPPQTRIWSHWENTVWKIWKDKGIGEVLIYDQDPVRWRRNSNYKDHSWPSVGNNTDVYILKNNLFPKDKIDALQSLIQWRDWIEDYGGSAFGTVASCSWSLWRATFKEDFYSPTEWPTHIKFPIGGRLIPCKEINSAWVGEFIQWDLQAAYARELSKVRYGGRGSKWVEVKQTADYKAMSERGIPIYVRAKVWIPRMKLGPLPQRRIKYNPFSRVPIAYRTNVQLYGTWTLEEIEQAREVGCGINIESVYAHVATGKELHFQSWWKAIEDGREHLEGFAKSLAKSTGNSLWGQFALREKGRKIRWIDDDGKRKHRVIEARMTNRPGSPELSDQLTGKIRAKLYSLAVSAGDDLMQGNTDGAWVSHREGWLPPDGWRIKKRARVIEFIDESNYRYWETDKGKPTYVMPGIPMDWQERYFTADWNQLIAKGEVI